MIKFIFSLIVSLTICNSYAQSFSMGDCSEAANPNNPYDNIGPLHNAFLEHLMNNLSESERLNSETIMAEAVQHARSYLSEEELEKLVNSNGLEMINMMITQINKSELPSTEELLTGIEISETSRNALVTIINNIYNYETLNKEFFEVKPVIVEWEDGIEQLNIPANEKNALYAFGSTLRYSLLGFDNYSNIGIESAASHGPLMRNASKWKLLGFIVTAVCDAVGAVGGAMVGNPVLFGAIGSGMGAAVATANGWWTY